MHTKITLPGTVIIALIGAVLFVGTTGTSAHAATTQASVVSRSPRLLNLPTGRSVAVTITIKNESKTRWASTGSAAVRLRLAPTAKGKLRHRAWQDRTLARLAAPVAPGSTAVFKFAVTAPRTSGYVEDTLQLVSGSTELRGGAFTLGAVVGTSTERHLAATMLANVDLTLAAGTEQTITLPVTNAGHFTWPKSGWGAVSLQPGPVPASGFTFQSLSWTSATLVSLLPTARLASGGALNLSLPVKAPWQPGSYDRTFQLVAQNLGPIAGGRVTVHITVPPLTIPVLPAEPIVRVGLFSQTINPTATITAAGEAKLTATDGTILAPALTTVTCTKVGTTYHYVTDTVSGDSALPLRVEAPTTTILTISSWSNKPSASSTANYNAFRGTLEFRTGDTGSTTVINELPIDTYLSGLAEFGGTDALEFRKALITAARSYALFHAAKKTRHAADHYDLNATTDQVYKGYNYETRFSSVREAVEATRGMVLFHPAARSNLNPDGIALGAYSGCSDGRTRSFQEVFGGDGVLTPYLISVPDPNGICTNQRYLQGLDGNHMVGISAVGARKAALAGQTYDQILSYYYQTIILQSYYNATTTTTTPPAS